MLTYVVRIVLACCLLFAALPAGATTLTLPPATWLAGAALPESREGRPLLLQFWASWCGGCAGVAAQVAELRAGSAVLHLAIGIDDTVAPARAAAARLGQAGGADMAVLWDGEAGWAARHAVRTVPTLVLLDAAGTPRLRLEGHPDSAGLTALAQALAALAAEPAS